MQTNDLFPPRKKITRKSIISVVLVWLFILLSIISLIIGYEDLFLGIFLIIQFLGIGLIIWNSDKKKKLLLALFITFSLGMFFEYIAINYTTIFGEYEYGEGMGLKFFGVPVMIGINWSSLTYCTAAISEKISNNKIVTSILGAILFVALDIVVEATAQWFDLWENFNYNQPILEHIAWFIVSFIAHFLFMKVVKLFNYTIAFHLFTSVFVLQIVLIYFTNTIL